MSPPKYTNKLAGSTVLILGGTSGLGFGLAEALIEYDVSHLYISSSRQHKVDSSIARLQASYPASQTKLVGLTCDLGDEASLEQNIAALFAQIDRKLDHVVHTAGDPLAKKPVQEVSMAFMKQAGMVRFFSCFFVAQQAWRHMNPGPASSITFTSGYVAEKPLPEWSVVGSYSAGQHGMTKGLALDMKPLRVNLVAPGFVPTEMWSASATDEEMKDMVEGLRRRTATGQVGRVEDVVESFLYVMKDHYVTGSVVRTDGGVFLL